MKSFSSQSYRKLGSRDNQSEQKCKSERSFDIPPVRVQSGMHIRKIFYTPGQYDDFELSSIKEFKSFISAKMEFEVQFDDATYLRFLYSGGFDLEDSAMRLSTFNQWLNNPDIQILKPNSRAILETGLIYHYGRDQEGHPVIYLNMAQADFTKYAMGDYYCAWNSLTKHIIESVFIPGKIQTWVVVIDTQSKFLLPIHMLEWIVRKLSVVYCHRLKKLYVVNTIPIVKLVYAAIKGFFHQETRKKIEILSSGEMDKLKFIIPAEELQQKYGGNLLNLQKYWPNQDFGVSERQLDKKNYAERSTISCTPKEDLSMQKGQQSRGFLECESVLNDEDFFYGKKQGLQSAKQGSLCCNFCVLF